MDKRHISLEDLAKLKSQRELIRLFKSNGSASSDRIDKRLEYELELERLQVALGVMHRWVQFNAQRVAIIFEGRDAAGKGGTIRRFTEHLNPRAMRVVALPKPTEKEKGQWYFQRYVNHLPNPGEIVFFDRSWYNRAVVEPVNGFCTREEYKRFMRQVPEFEQMLLDSGIILIKFWFSISKSEQRKRFASRKVNPLKQWKLSSLDHRAQELWEDYSRYKERMFKNTDSDQSPWIIVQANNKKIARLQSIRYVLNTVPYRADAETFEIDPDIIARYAGA